MPVVTNIEDLRVLAQKRVPRMFYDYADSGSWTEQTYRENTSDFEKIRLRQKVATNMEGRTTEFTMLGESLSMPVVLAPVGSTGMQHADGEILACRAAHDFGIQFTLSTMSVCSVEAVADAVEKPFWLIAPRRRAARRWSSRSICRSLGSGTRTSKTGFRCRQSQRCP